MKIGEKIRFGVVGLGSRGTGLTKDVLLNMEDVEVTAICDVYKDRTDNISQIIKEKTGNVPFATAKYETLVKRKDVDAVLVSCAWEYHVPVAVAAMRAHKAVAFEVGGACCVEDCWQLVRTQEETGTPFMFLENCCFDRSELLATSMARHGLFGQIVDCAGCYMHDLRTEILQGIENRHYRLRNYMLRNCENYPTHELGPIAKILGINRGNRMLSLVSIASKSASLEEYVNENKDKVNPALIGKKFAQGDIIHTIIKCAGGETILLRLDTTLPHFYSREFKIRGTKGFFDDSMGLVYLDGVHDESNSYRSLAGNACEYEEKYLPKVWKDITDEMLKAGHGGMDALEFRAFADALKAGNEMPIDVYDAAAWMVISALSEQSIAMGGAPVAIPDFTGGRWDMREITDVVPLP